MGKGLTVKASRAQQTWGTHTDPADHQPCALVAMPPCQSCKAPSSSLKVPSSSSSLSWGCLLVLGSQSLPFSSSSLLLLPGLSRGPVPSAAAGGPPALCFLPRRWEKQQTNRQTNKTPKKQPNKRSPGHPPEGCVSRVPPPPGTCPAMEVSPTEPGCARCCVRTCSPFPPSAACFSPCSPSISCRTHISLPLLPLLPSCPGTGRDSPHAWWLPSIAAGGARSPAVQTSRWDLHGAGCWSPPARGVRWAKHPQPLPRRWSWQWPGFCGERETRRRPFALRSHHLRGETQQVCLLPLPR